MGVDWNRHYYPGHRWIKCTVYLVGETFKVGTKLSLKPKAYQKVWSSDRGKQSQPHREGEVFDSLARMELGRTTTILMFFRTHEPTSGKSELLDLTNTGTLSTSRRRLDIYSENVGSMMNGRQAKSSNIARLNRIPEQNFY